jgi:ABC-2 type transport system ATP-binding protein
MSMQSQHVLQASGLRKSYPTGRGKEPVRALDGLDLEVERGHVLALLGPNGAGKSTTVKILATLARPEGGTAMVAGHDVTTDPAAVRRRIGLVSQKAGSDPMATGRENLVLAGRIHGLSRQHARDRAERLLERFDLTDAADRLVRTWSGGMSRRLDVAIGLVAAPEVLFLDEPTTGLDPEARSALWAEIALLAREDTTVLLTTHYLGEADRLADEVAIVDHGRIVVNGTPDDLKSRLRGDTVTLVVADPQRAGAAAERLRTTAGVSEALVEGPTVRARCTAGAQVLPSVLAGLEASGIGLLSAALSRPSLDDVYLAHVGRPLSDDAGRRSLHSEAVA